MNNTDAIYTSLNQPLNQPLYKPNLLNPISLSDNLILGTHIVVSNQNNENPLLENSNLLVTDDLRSSRMLSESLSGDSNLISDKYLLPDGTLSENRHVLIQTTDSNGGYLENCPRNSLLSTANDIMLVGKNEEYEKAQMLHMGFNGNVEMPLGTTRQDVSLCENVENIQTVYTNLQNVPSKKRKHSQDVPLVKSEPGIMLIIHSYLIIIYLYHIWYTCM